MRKLSENLFAPAFDRSRTGDVRKEDMVKTNIDTLICSIHIGNVYWASTELTIDGESIFSINDFKKLGKNALNGWRLPTLDEMKEMVETVYPVSITSRFFNVYADKDCKGPGIILFTLDNMQISEEGEYNVVRWLGPGKGISKLHLAKNSHITKVKLVRDNKI